MHPVVMPPRPPFTGASSIGTAVRQASSQRVCRAGEKETTLCCAPKLGLPGAGVTGLAVAIVFEFGVLNFRLRIFCISGNRLGETWRRPGVFVSCVGSLAEQEWGWRCVWGAELKCWKKLHEIWTDLCAVYDAFSLQISLSMC